MKARQPLPPIEFLREMFRFDPETGVLYWSDKQENPRWQGKPAGCKRYQSYDGTPQGIRINALYEWEQFTFYVHHAVAAMHGIECGPLEVIDHRDGNPFNNRLDNLRVATNGQNIANAKRRRDVEIGPLLPKGVHFNRSSGRFQAKMGLNGKPIYLGEFDCPIKAHEAYCKKAGELHGEFFRSK